MHRWSVWSARMIAGERESYLTDDVRFDFGKCCAWTRVSFLSLHRPIRGEMFAGRGQNNMLTTVCRKYETNFWYTAIAMLKCSRGACFSCTGTILFLFPSPDRGQGRRRNVLEVRIISVTSCRRCEYRTGTDRRRRGCGGEGIEKV